jgi:hypothetical protein
MDSVSEKVMKRLESDTELNLKIQKAIDESIQKRIESDEDFKIKYVNAVREAVEKELIDAHVIKSDELNIDFFRDQAYTQKAPKTACKCP